MNATIPGLSGTSTAWTLQGQKFGVQNSVRPLGILTHHADAAVRKLAVLVPEVARVKPHKRRRLKFLAENYRSLPLQKPRSG
ncbi:MAG: hypothetical protein JOZ60_00030 [Verrucomicrobia bacterium]|nr:hypothetical protein [Verrucomicrobiota bacterium]